LSDNTCKSFGLNVLPVLQGSSTMKTLRLHGIHDLRMTDDPKPVPGPGEELIKVSAVGVCGSDAHWYTEARVGNVLLTQPLILGHEFSAVIASGPRSGTRVTVDPALPCGKCEYCLEGKPNVCPNIQFAGTGDFDGSLREYMTWPSSALIPLPDTVSDVEGALLEPLGVALHAMNLAKMTPGMTAGVYGCGPIGLLVIQLARLAGAVEIYATDKIPARLEAAKAMGATHTYLADGHESQSILSATGGRGLDVTFEAAGDHGAVETAVLTAKPGGKFVMIGINADDRTIFPASPARKKGLTILIVRRMKNVYPRAIQLVAAGLVDVKSLVSRCFPFEEYDEAFRQAEARAGLKMVIEFANGADA
jgi:L-iditol 2-dehydrogenase